MSSARKFDLKFGEMLRRALSLWPEELDVQHLTFHGGDNAVYSVGSLHEKYEDIVASYGSSAEDFFMINMHWSIVRVVHKAASFVTVLKISSIRSDAIKNEFDSLINKIRVGGAPEFDDDVINLSKKYFLENQ